MKPDMPILSTLSFKHKKKFPTLVAVHTSYKKLCNRIKINVLHLRVGLKFQT